MSTEKDKKVWNPYFSGKTVHWKSSVDKHIWKGKVKRQLSKSDEIRKAKLKLFGHDDQYEQNQCRAGESFFFDQDSPGGTSCRKRSRKFKNGGDKDDDDESILTWECSSLDSTDTRDEVDHVYNDTESEVCDQDGEDVVSDDVTDGKAMTPGRRPASLISMVAIIGINLLCWGVESLFDIYNNVTSLPIFRR